MFVGVPLNLFACDIAAQEPSLKVEQDDTANLQPVPEWGVSLFFGDFEVLTHPPRKKLPVKQPEVFPDMAVVSRA